MFRTVLSREFPLSDSEPLPSFVDLGTVRSMSKMALHLAVAKEAIRQIYEAEEFLLGRQVTKGELSVTAKEIAGYARQVSMEAAKAWTLLQNVKMDVRQYERELSNAID